MRAALLITISAVSLFTAMTGQAQTVLSDESAHLARERKLDEATEARRLKLNEQLQAAEKSGNQTAVQQIRTKLAIDDQQLQREKAMSSADAANGGFAAHEVRERRLDEGTEARRLTLHRQLTAAQQSSNKAAIARIQSQLAVDDQQLEREKAMHAADGSH